MRGRGWANLTSVNRFAARWRVVVGMAVWACGGTRVSIDWSDPVPLPQQLASSSQLAFDVHDQLFAKNAPRVNPPARPAQCPATVRAARDSAAWYATWWSLKSDSTADLVVSRSDDGVSWTPPMRVDSMDAKAVACRRPPPSIAVDGDNVYVAYAMAAREGPGIFASHSMDRGMTFHSPVAVVYGDRIGLTSIAARGYLVAVAYEDPNSDPQRIGVAFSRTQGHTFENRELVSPPTGPARAPEIALGGGVIAVSWERGSSDDTTATRMLRQGRIR